MHRDETTLPSLLQPSAFNTHGAGKVGLACTKARIWIKHSWEKTLARKKSDTVRVEKAGGLSNQPVDQGKQDRSAVATCDTS